MHIENIGGYWGRSFFDQGTGFGSQRAQGSRPGQRQPRNSGCRNIPLGTGLGALPDPRWSQANDRFNAEVEQIATQTGGYRYDAEKASHELLTRWLDDRRRATPR